MEKKTRDDSIDAVKGFAILLVMLGHCIVLNNMADGIIYDAVKAIQMPLFMFVSGYLCMHSSPVKSVKAFFSVLKKRAFAYLLPFFSWILLTHLTNPLDAVIQTLFQLDRGLWFLMVLFIFQILTALAQLVQYKTGLGIFGFILVIVLGACGICTQLLLGNTFLSPDLSIYYLPFYLAGYVICACMKNLHEEDTLGYEGKDRHVLANVLCTVYGKVCKTKTVKVLMAVSFLIFVVNITVFDMVVANNKFELLLQIFTSFLGCFLCFYIIYHLPIGKIKHAFSYIGLYTLEIYVLHFRFATLLGMKEKGLSLYSLKGMGYVAAAFILMSVLTAGCIFLMKKIWLLDLIFFGKMRGK